MVPSRSKGSSGQTYRYYTCGEYHNKGKQACRPNSIRADKAEKQVFEELTRIVSQPTVLREIIEETNKQRVHSTEPIQEEIKLIQNKINKLTKHIDKRMNALLDGDIPQDIVAGIKWWVSGRGHVRAEMFLFLSYPRPPALSPLPRPGALPIFRPPPAPGQQARRQLRESLPSDGDVISGGVRAGVAGAEADRPRLDRKSTPLEPSTLRKIGSRVLL
ncbi:hypothetical protein BTM36_26540 [Herbaspirillum sp. VT-16-41]|nr:hypothetical protein BTM36_26540 [Herbaspirillum sp. VT-16-41]